MILISKHVPLPPMHRSRFVISQFVPFLFHYAREQDRSRYGFPLSQRPNNVMNNKRILQLWFIFFRKNLARLSTQLHNDTTFISADLRMFFLLYERIDMCDVYADLHVYAIVWCRWYSVRQIAWHKLYFSFSIFIQWKMFVWISRVLEWWSAHWEWSSNTCCFLIAFECAVWWHHNRRAPNLTTLLVVLSRTTHREHSNGWWRIHRFMAWLSLRYFCLTYEKIAHGIICLVDVMCVLRDKWASNVITQYCPGK